jgi:hypothetical protein
MRVKFASLISVVLVVASTSAIRLNAEAQQYSHRDVQPQSATLLSHIGHNDFAKSNFNFQLGVRGDSTSPPTRNIYDLRYGGLSYNHDSDWFDVPIAHGSRSKIIDLGALNWLDVYDIPILYASLEPYDGMRTDSINHGRLVSSLPENTLVKVIVGHMYLLHARDNDRDLYVMFRVESLKPGDEVTISWKVVPSPENK